MTAFNRTPTRRCTVTHLTLPLNLFPYTHPTDADRSALGVLFKNVSQRASNGRYHAAYAANHSDRYVTHPIEMDPTWVNDPTKFGFDVIIHLGMPRVNAAGNKLSLDRIDNSKGYFLGNLRWATALEQVMNQDRTRVPVY